MCLQEKNVIVFAFYSTTNRDKDRNTAQLPKHSKQSSECTSKEGSYVYNRKNTVIQLEKCIIVLRNLKKIIRKELVKVYSFNFQPLRDIAVVCGQTAKFECIVQSEPPPNIMWSKNSRVLENSNHHELHYRNGVCRLTIPNAYIGKSIFTESENIQQKNQPHFKYEGVYYIYFQMMLELIHVLQVILLGRLLPQLILKYQVREDLRIFKNW